jgi:hypothetical protein
MEKNKWLTSKELMDRWGINEPTLADYIYRGNLKIRSLSNFGWCDRRQGLIGSLCLTPGGKIYLREHGIWSMGGIVKNLDDFIFSPRDVLEFETGKNLKTEEEKLHLENAASSKGAKKREAEKPTPKIEEREFKHSQDYSSVNLHGKPFTLTPIQARVIEMLDQARLNGTPYLHQSSIIKEVCAHTDTTRLRDLFKTNPKAWKELIEPGTKKGMKRLKF